MTTSAHSGIRLTGWVGAGLVLWSACLPVAWIVVNAAHLVIGGDADFPESLAEVAFGYLYGGVLPLAVALPLLVSLGRRRPELFRRMSVAVCLGLGSLLGAYLLGIDDHAIQTYLVAWLFFGLVVPRPSPPRRAGSLRPSRAPSGPRPTSNST